MSALKQWKELRNTCPTTRQTPLRYVPLNQIHGLYADFLERQCISNVVNRSLKEMIKKKEEDKKSLHSKLAQSMARETYQYYKTGLIMKTMDSLKTRWTIPFGKHKKVRLPQHVGTNGFV